MGCIFNKDEFHVPTRHEMIKTAISKCKYKRCKHCDKKQQYLCKFCKKCVMCSFKRKCMVHEIKESNLENCINCKAYIDNICNKCKWCIHCIKKNRVKICP